MAWLVLVSSASMDLSSARWLSSPVEVLGLRADDRVGDEAVVVAVEGAERVEHGWLDGVGLDAGSRRPCRCRSWSG